MSSRGDISGSWEGISGSLEVSTEMAYCWRGCRIGQIRHVEAWRRVISSGAAQLRGRQAQESGGAGEAGWNLLLSLSPPLCPPQEGPVGWRGLRLRPGQPGIVPSDRGIGQGSGLQVEFLAVRASGQDRPRGGRLALRSLAPHPKAVPPLWSVSGKCGVCPHLPPTHLTTEQKERMSVMCHLGKALLLLAI